MSERFQHNRLISSSAVPVPATRASTLRGLPLTGLRAVVAASAALALLSLLLPSTPTYDPWSWLIWGREITHLALDTRSGPSWKPLPVAFTTVFGLVPGAAPDLWVAVARFGAIAALACAFRTGRLLGRGSMAAGLVAALALAVSTNFLRYAAVGDSEGLLVALLLAAVELHLRSRLRAALWLCFGAALLRPECWPFVGLYALWLGWRDPSARLLIGGLGVATLVLWYGPELWGSGDLLRASNRARTPNSNALSFAKHPWIEVIKRAREMTPWPVLIGFPLAIGLALRDHRETINRVVLLGGAAALTWVAVVCVMTEHGFSGNARYLIAPVALICLVGGVGLAGAAALLARNRATLGAAAALAGTVVFVVAHGDLGTLRDNARAARNEARLMDRLDDAVALAGGPAAIRRCGAATIGPFQVPSLAWRLDVPIRRVGFMPRQPGFVFRAAPPPRAVTGAPVIPLHGDRWRILGRTGPWQVVTTCASG